MSAPTAVSLETGKAAPKMPDAEFGREVCELVRQNARASGKAPLGPPELKRHEKREAFRELLSDDARKRGRPAKLLARRSMASRKLSSPTGTKSGSPGRVERHTTILRGIAHEITPDPERPDRPKNSSEARARFEAHLAKLREEAPRSGLGAAHRPLRGPFHRSERTVRIASLRLHRRSPSEAIHQHARGLLRSGEATASSSLCAGSTSNSTAQNLGGDYLAAFALLESSNGDLSAKLVPDDASRFREERQRIAAAEAPITRRRSLVRRFDQHLARLRDGLYHCYDDSRIPHTTNELEGAHGVHKHHIRKAAGRRSTSGGPTETAGEFVTCAIDLMKPGRRLHIASVDPVAYAAARRELARLREPARRYRSVQRAPEKHLAATLALWEAH